MEEEEKEEEKQRCRFLEASGDATRQARSKVRQMRPESLRKGEAMTGIKEIGRKNKSGQEGKKKKEGKRKKEKKNKEKQHDKKQKTD